MRGGREAKGNFRPPEPLEGDAKAQGANDVVLLTVACDTTYVSFLDDWRSGAP